MMKKVGIVAGAVVVAVMVGVGCDSKISPEEVRSELLAMREADQMARQRLIAGGMTDTVLAAELTRLDSVNAARVKEIVEEVGFPTADMVGREGMEAFFLVVQHASHDPEFQMRSLPPIQRAAKRGELSKEAVALLTDRTLLALGKEQVYGTQFDLTDSGFVAMPIRDSAGVDARRAEMGLPPLEEYRQKLEEIYIGEE